MLHAADCHILLTFVLQTLEALVGQIQDRLQDFGAIMDEQRKAKSKRVKVSA